MRTEPFDTAGVFGMFLSPRVLLENDLSATERLILIIIAVLDKYPRGCDLSNAQLGWLSGCSPGTVSKSVNRMYQLGYIIVNKQSVINGGRSYMRKVAPFVKRELG